MSDADQDLLARADDQAFAELQRRHAPMVTATCRRVLGDRMLADDAAQETFLQLLRDRARVRGAVGAWLHRVATTKALDLRRREGRLRARERAAPAPSAADDELVAAVDEALDALSDERRELLVATHLEGASQAQLAMRLGCSQATVSRRLADAEEALRDRLREAGLAVGIALMLAALHGDDPVAAPPSAAPRAWLAPLTGVAAVAVLAVATAIGWWPRAAPPPSSPRVEPPREAPAHTFIDEDPTMAQQELMRRAVAAIYAGDQATLAALLKEHRALARARIESDEKPYDAGYFHGATLLHHVAGNPNPATGMVPRAVESARLLLAAGADVDARTLAEPTTANATTLALVVSSAPECIGDQRDALVDLLIASGADVDADGGEPLAAALFYRTNSAGGVAAMVRHHPRLDVRFAAGVGDLATLRTFFAADGSLKPGTSFLSRYPHGPAGSDQRPTPVILADALCFACGAEPAAARSAVVAELLAHGASPRVVVDGCTALHVAAMIGDVPLVELLLAHGGDPAIRDDRFHATAEGWAAHFKRDDVVALLHARTSP